MISCQRCQQAIANQSVFDAMGNQVFLCAGCAHQAYFQHGAGAVQKFLLPVLHAAAEMQAPCCPSCGITLQQLRQTTHLGCADCYRHFRQQILPAVKRMQGTLQHIDPEPEPNPAGESELQLGQLPEPQLPEVASAPESLDLGSQSLDELQLLLDKALEVEDYELAVRIRDRVRELRKESP